MARDSLGVWLAPLTRRQREIVLLVVSGEASSVPQLAEHLGVSRETVRSHLKAIYRVLEVDGRLSLTLGFWSRRALETRVGRIPS